MLAQRANIMIKKKSNLVLAAGLLSSRYAQCVKVPGKNLISLFFVAGENHELHPAKQVQVLGKSISTPSIVVQVCGQEVDEVLYPNSKRIRATKCPERQNSLDWISFSPHLSTSIIINYYHQKKTKNWEKIMEWIIPEKNLTFLTVLGLSKKKREKGKEIKEEKPKRYIIPPEYYPCTTPYEYACF